MPASTRVQSCTPMSGLPNGSADLILFLGGVRQQKEYLAAPIRRSTSSVRLSPLVIRLRGTSIQERLRQRIRLPEPWLRAVWAGPPSTFNPRLNLMPSALPLSYPYALHRGRKVGGWN